MKGKNVIAFLISILVAIKCYIVLYSWPINDGPYQKVNRSDLEIEIDDNGYSLIIDQKIKVVNEEAVSHLKHETTSALAIILSAPNNFNARQITRNQLNDTLQRGMKWVFVIGQTTKEIQVGLENEMQIYGDILQLSINDGYQNLSYKTLSAYAWIWQTFDTSLNWVIKLDDDLDLKMNKILDRLPLNESQSYPYVHCPCIHHKIDAHRFIEYNRKSMNHTLWPFDGPFPSYCNGYMYALKPRTAMKLAAVAKSTPFLPLDDIFVTGVLRDRLQNPPATLKFLNRFEHGTTFLEWCLHCPFLGIINYAFVQDVAYQRGYWPWDALNDMIRLFLEQYIIVMS